MKAVNRFFKAALAAGFLTACSWSAGTVAQADTTPGLADQRNVNVTYIANEGVLIAAKGKKVLIDGLHQKYLDEYSYPPDDLREKLESAKGEFEGIDLVLVSHIHGDHFHPGSVGRLLASDKHSVLASSPQVVQSIEENFSDYEKVKSRVHAVGFEFGKESSLETGILVRYLALSHGTGRHATIQNLGHVIDVGGVRFLHLGDADMTDENFSPFELEKAGIDVAFIPYWYLRSEKGREFVDRQFAPKHIIAVHVDVNRAAEIKKDLEARDPRIRVFTKILETASF